MQILYTMTFQSGLLCLNTPLVLNTLLPILKHSETPTCGKQFNNENDGPGRLNCTVVVFQTGNTA